MYFYILTIKPYKLDFQHKAQLDYILWQVKRKVRRCQFSAFVGYEFDKVNRLHLHTIVSREMKITKYQFEIEGYGVNFTEFPIEDYDNVVSYIRKDGLTPEGADMLNKVYHFHMDDIK